MTISKQSASKLFSTHTVERQEPFVERVDFHADPNSYTAEPDQNYTSYVQQMNRLAYGFDSMSIEYDKLIDILIKRAELRDVKLQVTDIAKSDMSFANALSVLYGKQIKEIDFAAYVNLLKHEQIIASSHTVQLVNVDNPQLPDIKNTSSVISQPESAAITAIKKEYLKYLTNNNFDDLLMVDILIYNQHTALSGKASVQKLSETTDGRSVLRQGNASLENEDKIKDLLDECFPCAERSLMVLGQMPKIKLWDYFINNLWKQFLSQLQQLAQMKLALTNTGVGSSLCSMINILANSMCLPDLVALLALVKMMIAKVKNALVGKFNLSAGAAINDLVSLIIQPVLDAVLSLLMRAISSVLSPIDCVLDSIQYEMDKTLPAINEVSAELGYSSLAQPLSIQSPVRDIRKLMSDIQREKQDIEAKILTFINEKTKNWELKLFDENEALDLYIDLDRYMRFAGMVYEIIDLSKTVGKALKSGMTEEEKREAYQRICSHSITNGKPWINIIDVNDDPSPIGDPRGTRGKDRTNPRDPIDPTRPIGDPGPPIGVPGYDGDLIVDISIPPDFYDGEDIVSVLDDSEIKKIIDGLTYDTSVQDGSDPLALSDDLISNYRTQKIQFKNNISTINNIIKSNDTTDVQNFFVVGRVDFASCLALNNLQGQSDEQIQNWINKIIG
jgi:hypothetical protein